jgi:hypothetical protein
MLIVGASGIIGRAVVAELGQRHEIVTAGRSSGDVRLDITERVDQRGIQEGRQARRRGLRDRRGEVHAAREMQASDFDIGLRDAGEGQPGADGRDRRGRRLVHAHGGVLDSDPIRAARRRSLVGGAPAFVLAAASSCRDACTSTS